MSSPSDGSDQQLEIEALRALSGADDVRKRLLAGLSMGNPSLEAQAYLIKSRIKDHQSLVTKVRDRRRAGKQDYACTDVTDIVGLRILTLYKNELPLILKSFLSFIKWAQPEPFSLFWGETFAEAVHEAIIYRTVDPSDPITQHVIQEFKNHEFMLHEDGATAYGDGKLKLRVDHKPSEYSSIHLVLWCTGITKDKRFRIPLEVQLRTSLEDIWGEIDHQIQYKYQIASDHDNPNTKEVFYQMALRLLGNLKKNLDGCSDIADVIQQQVKYVFEPASFETRQNINSISMDIHRLNGLDLPRKLQESVNETVDKLASVYRDIFNSSSTPSNDLVLRALREFTSAANSFGNYLTEYEKSPFQDRERDKEVRYLLPMERALCLYWRAFLIKIAMKHELKVPETESNFTEAIKEALRQYVDLAKDPRFSDDALLAFRLGNTLSLNGDSELALDRYQAAVKLLVKSSLPENHYMRVKIPRQLSIALWEAGEEIKRKDTMLNLGGAANRRRLEYYLSALDVTKPLLDFKTVGNVLDQLDERQTKAEEVKRITLNNLLEYSVSFLGGGGSLEELEEHGLSRETLDAYLRELVGNGLSTVAQPTVADTIRAVARYLGDRELAMDAAKRVLELMEDRDFALPLSDQVYEEMRRDAFAELAGNRNQT